MMALLLFFYNSVQKRVCSFTNREKTKESFRPEQEGKSVLYLKESSSFSSWESAVTWRSSQGSVSPRGVAVDSIPRVLRAKGQATRFIKSPAMVSIIVGGRDIVPLRRRGNRGLASLDASMTPVGDTAEVTLCWCNSRTPAVSVLGSGNMSAAPAPGTAPPAAACLSPGHHLRCCPCVSCCWADERQAGRQIPH